MRLPRLELPAGALLLFEHVPHGPDRSGGFRFAVCDDGRFLHAGNGALHVDPARLDDDDPALFWTAPLEEVTRFDPAAVDAIRAALPDLWSLPPTPKRQLGRVSEPTFERVTATAGGRVSSAVVTGGDRPPALAAVLERVEQAGRTA